MSQKMVTFTVTINEELAEGLAQFLTRVGFSDIRQNAIDDVEAYIMRDALNQVRIVLADAGYDPR